MLLTVTHVKMESLVMKQLIPKTMTTVSVLALALAVGGCGSSSNNTDDSMPPPDPTPVEPTPDPELTAAQTAASGAMTAAKTASDNAATANDDAQAAIMNLATMQTGGMAKDHAMAAKKAAGQAMDAYMAAKKASDAAAAATTVTAAVEARADAVAAQADAEKYEMMADKASKAAVAAAAMELKIDGTMKSVGGTMVDAMAAASSMTTDGQTVTTGRLMDMDPSHMAPAFTGRHGAQEDPATDANEAMTYRQAVAARSFDIGKTLDSSDDMARLVLVTHYAGSKTVNVFYRTPLANGGENIVATHVAGSRAGQIFIHNGTDGTPQTDDDVYADLVLLGTFYPVTDGGAATSDTGTATDNAADQDLDASDIVAADAKPQAVWSYQHLGADGAVGGGDDSVRYAIKTEEEVTFATDTVEISYARVDIMVTLPVVGAVAAKDIQATAQLPDAMAYDHIHFGVWAGLGKAAKSGAQDIADLGIGFVQSIGDGMSGDDMPNNGSGTYAGNWVAAVQAQDTPAGDDGDISLEHGAATLMANFGKGEITATLTGLATLSGDIDGNMFSGDEASDISAMHGLDAATDFEGSFSGGFYGTKAAEAGGIFDFASDDGEGGAFRGAFGAGRTDN